MIAVDRKRVFLMTFALLFLFTAGASNITANEAVHYDSHLQSLRTRLIDDGVDPVLVNRYFNDNRFELIPKLMKVNVKQPSGTAGYQRFLGDASVRTAAAYLELHRAELDSILKGSPVDPEVVVAILNVESSLGTYKGTYP